MSWWESASGITNLASVALKTAQKRIDKVLDIKEEEEASIATPPSSHVAASPAASPSKPEGDEQFFDSWLGSTPTPMASKKEPLKVASLSSSHKPQPQTTELSLKDKLEKKRAARAARKTAPSLSSSLRVDGITKQQQQQPWVGTDTIASDSAKQPVSNDDVEERRGGDADGDNPRLDAVDDSLGHQRLASETQSLRHHPQSAFSSVRRDVGQSELNKMSEWEAPISPSGSTTQLKHRSDTSQTLGDEANIQILNSNDGNITEVNTDAAPGTGFQSDALETPTPYSNDILCDIDQVRLIDNGTEQVADTCTEQVADSGTEQVADTCTEQGADSGTEQVADSGTIQVADSGTKQVTDSGKKQVAVSGIEHVADSGTEQVADSGTKQVADSDTEQVADSGTEQVADSGTEKMADSGTEQVVDSGTEQVADSGTEQVADSGTKQVAATDVLDGQLGVHLLTDDVSACESSEASQHSSVKLMSDTVSCEHLTCGVAVTRPDDSTELAPITSDNDSLPVSTARELLVISGELEMSVMSGEEEGTKGTGEVMLALGEVGGWDDVSLSVFSVTSSQSEVTDSAATDEQTTLPIATEDHVPSPQAVEHQTSLPQAVEDEETLSQLGTGWEDAGMDVSAQELNENLTEVVKQEADHSDNMTPVLVECGESQYMHTDTTDSSPLTLTQLSDNASAKDLEESSETIDELSDSNRTLTKEDIELARREAELDVKDWDSDGDVREGCMVAEDEVGVAKDSEKTDDCGIVSPLSSSSYVKTMLEEAMVESVKDTDSHSSSEMVRIESGHTSGHTSADEIDTTTSSDIEIISHISTPTPNGDGQKVERPFDLSPLRHAFRSVRRGSPPGHKRSDSSSSGLSAHSRSWEETFSPDAHLTRRESEQDHCHDGNNPLEPDKLLKKLAEVSEVLDAREKKLVSLSTENMELVEANTILRSQLQQAEESREAEMEDLNSLSEEFMQRIAEAEKRCQIVVREKEAIKKKLQEAEADILKKADRTVTEKQLKEKELVIQELMEEGQKLSKQQLQSSNIIKKLRAKEKETEATIKSQNKKIEAQTTEIEEMQKFLEAQVELERSQAEAISQLNAAVAKQESEILRLVSELEDSDEKCRSMKVTLDNSYKELADLHKAKATTASEAQQMSLQAEIRAKEEIRLAMDEYQYQTRNQHQTLITQIEDLQLSISRQDKEHGRREDALRQEISDLHQRLQEAEERNQELSQNVTAATRPLLRQIENLQATYTSQSMSCEKVERNLTERLADAQNQLAAAVEKERSGSERVMESMARLASLESQISMFRQEKSRLQAQLEMEKNRVQILEETKSSDLAQMEGVRIIMEKEISDLKKEKVVLENQLEMEKMKVESERKKVSSAQEQIREKELAIQGMKVSITPPGHHSREGSIVSLDTPMNMSLQSLSPSMALSQSEDNLEKNLWHAANANGNKMSLYESLRQSNATALVEHLQSQLKQKEGEIYQLQGEITELERTRESLARELVNISTERDAFDLQVKDLTVVQKQYQDLDGRYQALLQMYGEKEEQAQELQLDLQDMKELYKAQINELVKNK